MTTRPETRSQAIRLLESRRHSLDIQMSAEANNYIFPQVVESTHRGERSWDVFSRLLKDRIVFVGSAIDDVVANATIAQLLFLASEDADKDVQMYVNSPGGVVTSGMAMLDTMAYIPCDVSTTCLGQAASMGAMLLCQGAKGKRYALPNSRIMIHQPLGGARGQATDIEIQAREIRKMKETLTDMLVSATGQIREKIAADIERDFYLSAVEAKEYGLIDEVVTPKGKTSEKADDNA